MKEVLAVFLVLAWGAFSQPRAGGDSESVSYPELPFLQLNATLNHIRLYNVTTMANLIQGCAPGRGLRALDRGQLLSTYAFNATSIYFREVIVQVEVGPMCPGSDLSVNEEVNEWISGLPTSFRRLDYVLADAAAELDLCAPKTTYSPQQLAFAAGDIRERRLVLSMQVTRDCAGQVQAPTVAPQPSATPTGAPAHDSDDDDGKAHDGGEQDKGSHGGDNDSDGHGQDKDYQPYHGRPVTPDPSQISPSDQPARAPGQAGSLVGSVTDGSSTVYFSVRSVAVEDAEANVELILTDCEDIVGGNTAGDLGLPGVAHWGSNNETFEAARLRFSVSKRQRPGRNQQAASCNANTAAADRVSTNSSLAGRLAFTARNVSMETVNVYAAVFCYNRTGDGPRRLAPLGLMIFNGTNMTFHEVEVEATVLNRTSCFLSPVEAQCQNFQPISFSTPDGQTHKVAIYQQNLTGLEARALCRRCSGTELWMAPSPDAVSAFPSSEPYWIGGVAGSAAPPSEAESCMLMQKPTVNPVDCGQRHKSVCDDSDDY